MACLVGRCPPAAAAPHAYGSLPLHVLCRNPAVRLGSLEALVEANPHATAAKNGQGLYALHALSSNCPGAAAPGALAFLLDWHPDAAKDRSCATTPLHALCRNRAATPALLQEFLGW